MRYLALLLCLTACTIQNDVPEFVFPDSTKARDETFPTLLPLADIYTVKAETRASDTASLDALRARAQRLQSRAVAPVNAGISDARIARLKARAEALSRAEF